MTALQIANIVRQRVIPPSVRPGSSNESSRTDIQGPGLVPRLFIHHPSYLCYIHSTKRGYHTGISTQDDTATTRRSNRSASYKATATATAASIIVHCQEQRVVSKSKWNRIIIQHREQQQASATGTHVTCTRVWPPTQETFIWD